MAAKSRSQKIEPRPKARMSLATSRQRINQKYGDTLAKLAQKA
jgi:hypothetical protein